MAALAKDPTLRPQSAAAFAEALRMPAGEAPSTSSRVLPRPSHPSSWVSRPTWARGDPADLGHAHPAPFGADITTAADSTESVLHDTRRPPWLIPAAAALVVLLVIVTAIALGSRGATAGAGGSGGTATTHGTEPPRRRRLRTTDTTASQTSAPATTATPPAPAHKGKGSGNGKGGKKK